MKHTSQAGQALVLGLSVFAIAGLGALYLLRLLQAEQAQSLARMRERANAMRTCQDFAHVLNTIAFHNHYTLKSLADAANAWSEAGEWSLAITNAHPFWERENPDTVPNRIFEKFSGSASAAFAMASANSHAAKQLAKELETRERALAGAFGQTNNALALCMAVEQRHKNVGVYPVARTECDLRIFSGKLVSFANAVQVIPLQNVGLTIPQNEAAIERWMRQCRELSKQGLNVVVRHKLFEEALKRPANKEKQRLFARAFLTPAWTTSLEMKDNAHAEPKF